ncbi:MAG: hypothetical protein J0H62_04135 [Rhizobiales bacterium]|nr:hypothetical protein [Hyphomicrobiales bacterium]
MILGLSPNAFLVLHVAVSMVAIATGFIVVGGMFSSAMLPGWTLVFLVLTMATSATGFLFPIAGFTPALAVGALAIVILLLAAYALYAQRMNGGWRTVYVVSALAALYFNSFVFVVQSFQKVGFLQAIAPTQSEPPFAITQGVLLLAFVAMGWTLLRRFHPEVRLA